MQEVAEHFTKIAQNSRLTTAQIMKSLFPIEEAANRHNPFPQRQLDDEDDPELPDYDEIRQEEEDNDNPDPNHEEAIQHVADLPQIVTPPHQQLPNEQMVKLADTVIVTTPKRHIDAPAQETDKPNHKSLRLKDTAELQSAAQQTLDQTQTPKRHRDDHPRPNQTHKFPRLNETTLTSTSLQASLTTPPIPITTTETAVLANRPSQRRTTRALPPSKANKSAFGPETQIQSSSL